MRIKNLAALAAMVGAVACSKQQPAVQEAPNGVDLQAEVVERGAEPREQLRYKRAEGLAENMVVEIGIASLLQTSDAAALVEAPVLALGLTAGQVHCEGPTLCKYPIVFKVIGIKMPEGASEAQAAEAAQAVAPLSGVSGEFEVDERGITRRADVKVPAGVSPRLLTLLGNVRTSLISVPLPEEAVGIGARWKVQRQHRVGNIETTQTVTYTLLEREARLLRLGVTMRQTAAPQEVALDGETKLKVESYEVTGTGSMVMSLDALTPLSEINATSDLRGAVQKGGQSEVLAAAGSVDVIVAPLPAAN